MTTSCITLTCRWWWYRSPLSESDLHSPSPPTPDPSDREKENARHLQLNICSRLFYGIKFISFILTRLKELYILQPRLQGLLVIQHGGDRREDPGTQRTKTIADWCFSCVDFDWLNLQKQKWWLLAGSS